ncbi:hypothetical protein [Paenibacillus thiaminolyticus]|uniref:hypothetical protein n=1 Tax=Paenibacillus thiaminolyticus TaxID=49283 RepID=UPI00215D887C|nr:hypothetical protein [Paenibacillus thiaminolyticus]
MHTRLRGNAGEQRATGTRHSFHPLRSVGMKLFLVFFVTIALLVGSVGLFSFFQARNIIQSQIAQAQEQTLIQVGRSWIYSSPTTLNYPPRFSSTKIYRPLF